MLKTGDDAPDFEVGERMLHQMLERRRVVVFFFPKTFTKG
jgi:peroxiredoxin